VNARLEDFGDVLMVGELAQVLGTSVRTIARQERAGVFPIPQIPGIDRKRRYARPVVAAFLASNGQQRVLKSRSSQSQHSERSLHHAGVSQQAIRDVHARQSDESADVTLRNSIVSERA
jgi:hypothetical protein